MNDDVNDIGGAPEGAGPGEGSEAVADAELAAAGAELRDGAAPVEGHDVIVASLRRRSDRARRSNWLIAGAASIVVVAVLAATLLDRQRPGDPVAGSRRAPSMVEGEVAAAAEALVASLPDEPVDPHDVQLVASVTRHDTCEALLDQLHRVGAAHIGSRGFGGESMYYGYDGLRQTLALTDGSPSMPSFSAADEASASGAGETLGTNVIVAGVDEADGVKATDTLIVEISGASLRIVDTAVPGVVGTLTLEDQPQSEDRQAHLSSLLVDGRRAVVFGSESIAADPIPGDPSAARPWFNYLTVTFVDLTDPTDAKITDRVRIEGRLVTVRRVGDQVRLLTNSSLADLPVVAPTTPNSVAPALHQNRLAVAESAIGDWVPEWDRGEETASEPLMECGDVVLPDTFAGVQMTSLVQFDLDGPFDPQAMGLLAPSETLTASSTDVVVASHVWVDPIDRADDFSDWSTALHHFTFDDAGPAYLASGAVDGSVRDEFSLSALGDGAVAAVTVDVLPWESREEADVTVRLLTSTPGSEQLDEVGSLVPAASNERLAGVRFVGDSLLLSSGVAGNVVSVVDLTDRRAPRDVGEVHMPGAGDYLHPLEDGRVLVIGSTLRKVGDDLRSGTHATLLDLSAAPRVVTTWERADSGTEVGYDHHAFTWWPSRGVAAFGVDRYSLGRTQPPPDALFLSVEGDALVPRIVAPTEADLGPKCPPEQIDRRGCDDTGPPRVHRVLVVDGAPWLYTSESAERLDPTSYSSSGVVPLRR